MENYKEKMMCKFLGKLDFTCRSESWCGGKCEEFLQFLLSL